ncbi:phage holin family protein [Solicola sp. PLA-1-18]|jgi:putative membrane protein|uniref:phage holin family protein n=1 Tax=Solicola sp. PLA-1-18 TaxID=3380532 RepID=UPI003B782B9A
MLQTVTTWLSNAAAIAVAAWLFGGIAVGTAADDTTQRVLTLLLIAAVFSLINALIAPVVKLLSLPFIVITLGLALLVINALLLLLTEWVTGKLDVAFVVEGFWWAVAGSIVISVVNGVLGLFFARD